MIWRVQLTIGYYEVNFDFNSCADACDFAKSAKTRQPVDDETKVEVAIKPIVIEEKED